MGMFNAGDWLYPDISQGRQPQYPAPVNPAHSLASSVLAVFNAGESLRFGQSFPTTIGGTPTVGGAGRCVDYASTKTQYPFNAAIANGMVTPAGCAVLAICDVDTLTNYGCIFSCEDASIQRNALEFRVGVTATDSNICLVRGISTAGSSNYRQFDTGSNRITAGSKGVRILVSFPDNNVQSAGTVYVNGISYTTSLSGSGTATGNVAAPTSVGVSLGGRSSDTVTSLDGRIYNAWVFGRGVTAAEGIALTKSINAPYALFANPPIDIWAPSASGTTNATIAGTDGADSAVCAAANWTTAQIASTDGADVASIAASATAVTSATIASTDGADTAIVSAENWMTAQLVGTDGADNAELAAANWATAQIAGTDSADNASITTVVGSTTIAAISGIDGADAASVFAANWTTALLSSIDGNDQSAIAGRVTTGAAIVLSDGADASSIIASGGGPISIEANVALVNRKASSVALVNRKASSVLLGNRHG